MTPEETVSYLDAKLLKAQRRLRKLDAYYEGEQPLRFLALELKQEFGERLAELVINWPEMVADAYEARLDLTGFRFPGSTSNGVDVDEADADVWGIWQDNDMDRQAPQAHLESIALGRSYAIVGARRGLDEGPAVDVPDPFDEDTDSPLITVEHPTQCITEQDPRTRQPVSALKRWKDADNVQRATLYLPDSTRHFYRARRWVEADRDKHRLGVVPVVPLVNRGRMLKHDGRSEFASVIPIADAANKMATDMMVSGEFHAMPRRWALGMSREDFEDEDGNPVSPFEQIAGRMWAHSKKPGEVAVGQFPESDLAVFHNTIKLLGQLAGQLSGLPPHYTQFTGDNPASADAIRSSEAQMVKRVERKQTGLGADWRRVMAIALRIRDGEAWDKRVRRMKVVWRDASTPTEAQAADAAVKKRQQGITTLRQARIDLGYSPEEIRRMEEEDAAERASDPVREIALGLAGGGPTVGGPAGGEDVDGAG
ncbi:phage portal protein [Micromonospora aurantiaca]|uniref:phage portal protein n=1 Tax=Micromonospora aurantiaca (nom. illeg.) TaxID=47850 RepID=UPI003446C6DA